MGVFEGPKHNDDANVEHLVAKALWLLQARLTPQRELAQLAAICRTDGGQRRLLSNLQPLLMSATAEAWRRGWQPVDVLRYAGRRLNPQQRRLAADLVALQLTEYAAATLPPSWPGQLSELEISMWWPADRSVLEVRAVEQGWQSLLRDALSVLQLVTSLPRIEQLGPLPGENQRTRRRVPEAEADPRVLSRVRALLAQAESTNFEAEAESFTAAAQALMARHRIDRALIEAANAAAQGTTEAGAEVQAQRLGIDDPYAASKALLLDEVARANRCRLVWSRDFGFGTVVGHAADRAAAEVLFTSLLVQATRAMTAAGSRARRDGRSRTRSFRSSFLTAFATRIGERLESVAQSEESAAAARAGGAALVPLLAARSAAVDAAVAEMFPTLRTRSLSAPSDREGWRAGLSAADQAQLGATTSLDSRYVD